MAARAMPLAIFTLLAAAASARPGSPLGGDAAARAAPEVVASGPAEGAAAPFVAVVRDAETYTALREIVTELPDLGASFFDARHAVVGILGARGPKGRAVTVTRAGDGVVRVSDVPASNGRVGAGGGAFTVAAIPAGPVRVELGAAWKGAMRRYRVERGSFESRGGIAGRTEKFPVEGRVGLLRLENVTTVALELAATGTPRRLRSLATGVVEPDGELRVPRLEAGGLVSAPNGGLRATGRVSPDTRRLDVRFEPLPSDVADAYEGRGALEAVLEAGRR